MPTRKVVKIDAEGKEVKNDKGEYVFEDVEIPGSSEESSGSDNSHSDGGTKNGKQSNSENKNEVEQNTKGVDIEEISTLAAKKALEQLNVQEPIKKIEKTEKEESKNVSSVGYDPRSGKIN